MGEPDTEAWTDNTNGRERVRMVVETLDEPATVSAIAKEADVAWATADSELERLVAENLASEHERDDQTVYGPNPVQQFLDQILTLIDDHDRDELEATLVEYQTRIEDLQEETGAESADAYRDVLAEEDLSAAEMREVRNTVSTWEALETERRLTKHALRFYDDVESLSGSGEDDFVTA